MYSTVIKTCATAAYVSLVAAKNTFIFVGCYNVVTPIIAYGYSTPICAVATSILVNFN